jgi:hypothetical protein
LSPTHNFYVTVNPPVGIKCNLIVIETITPQVEPPPPRKAQKRSLFYSEFTFVKIPSAKIISASKILSDPKPNYGAKGPCPPPKDHPTIPTVIAHPDAIALFIYPA